jgi:hypothetical protein
MQHNMAFIKVKILSDFEERKGGTLFVADAIDTNNRIIRIYTSLELKEKMHTDGYFALTSFKTTTNNDETKLMLNKGSKV